MSIFIEPYYTEKLNGKHPMSAWFDDVVSKYEHCNINYRIIQGVSMQPLLNDGDVALINTDITDTKTGMMVVDGIYDMTINGERHIKKLQHLLDGEHDYRIYTVDEGFVDLYLTKGVDELIIHGRMVGVIRCETKF